MCVTTSNANGITPYPMRYRRSPPLNLLHPFGTMGYLSRMKRENKLAPRRETCLIMIGIVQNHPSSTSRDLSVNPDKLILRQNVSWHHEMPEVRKDGHQATASGGGGNSTGGKQMPQPSFEVNMEVTTATSSTT